MRAGWTWKVQQRDLPVLAEALDCLYRFFWIRGRAFEGREIFAMPQPNCTADTPTNDRALHETVRSQLLLHWGMFCYFLGDYAEAETHLQASLTLARQQEWATDRGQRAQHARLDSCVAGQPG